MDSGTRVWTIHGEQIRPGTVQSAIAGGFGFFLTEGEAWAGLAEMHEQRAKEHDRAAADERALGQAALGQLAISETKAGTRFTA